MFRNGLILVSVLMLTSMSATAQDISRCLGISEASKRLACYDEIATPKPIPANAYTEVDLADFKVDRESLRGKKIKLSGTLHQLGELVLLGTEAFDTSPIFVEVKGLPREQRKLIVERCNNGCDVKIAGRVGTVFMQIGLIADSLTMQ